MYLKIKEVKAEKHFVLHLLYNNGETRFLDMKPYLDFGIFAELADEKLFQSVKISFDTIEWSNGADLDPEFLYEKSTPAHQFKMQKNCQSKM